MCAKKPNEDRIEGFDPVLLAVLANRFESIIKEMTNTVMRASRSSVIKNARDMSCGILNYDHRLVSVEEALPIHVTALELTARPITELFSYIKDYAKTIYEEGLHLPCVRIQENGEDKADLIRMGMQKIRVSNIWYGDYRAQVGACRTGERRPIRF